MAITFGADDKKKIYLLGGLLGLLGVAGLFTVVGPMLSGGGSDAPAASNTVSTTSTTASAPGSSTVPNGSTVPATFVMPPSAGGARFGAAGATSPASAGSGASTAGTATGAGTTPQLPGIGRTRSNPFVPTILDPLPPTPPTPTPRPTPIPTMVVTEPVPVVLPRYTTQLENTAVSLPASPFPSGGQQASAAAMVLLPRAEIFGGTRNSAPQPLPLVGGLEVGAPGAQTSAMNATGKRVSGVILGNTIRALIEYQENGQTVSKIVQPGDEVGGMRILSIQRIRSGEQSIVRVTARENGQEVYFDLGPGS